METHWKYNASIPLYRFVKEPYKAIGYDGNQLDNSPSVYIGVGKMANINLSFRNILGNQAITENNQIDLTLKYNDCLIEPNERPGNCMAYKICKDENNNKILQIVLEGYREVENTQISYKITPKSSIAKLITAMEQIKYTVSHIVVRTTLFVDSYPFTKDEIANTDTNKVMECDKDKLLKYLKQLLLFMQTEQIQTSVPSCTFTFKLPEDVNKMSKEPFAAQLESIRDRSEDEDYENLIETNLPSVCELVMDRLLRGLTESSKIDIITAYQLDFTMTQDKKCRMTTSVTLQNVPENTNEEVASQHQTTIQGTKLTSEHPLYCMFAGFKTEHKNLKINPALTIEELEYNIQKESDGYESSQWLKFFDPIKLKDFENETIFKEYLNSDVPWPNPLKRCPTTPVLTGQSVSVPSEKMESLRDLLKWDYIVSKKSATYEQDTLHFKVYSAQPTPVLKTANGILGI